MESLIGIRGIGAEQDVQIYVIYQLRGNQDDGQGDPGREGTITSEGKWVRARKYG